MIKPEVLDAMVAAGCTAEQIVAAVKADAQGDDARVAHKREVDAARKRRQRANVTVGHADTVGHDVTAQDAPSPKKETSPTPPKEKTTPSQSEPNGSSKTPRQALECVLDAKHAADLIEHRQRLRKGLTLRAAELLAAQLGQWPDPNAAVDAMILNGWQGFKPEWMDRQQARGSPGGFPRPERPDHFANQVRELTDGQDRSRRSDSRDWDDAQGVSFLAIDYER